MRRVIVLLVVFVVCSSEAVIWAQPASGGDGSVQSMLRRLDEVERTRRDPDTTVVGDGNPSAARTVEPPPAADGGVDLALWALGVAVAILGVALIVRKLRPPERNYDLSRVLDVQESMWIGRGQRLLLVRVRDREILVGASGASLSSLAVFAATGGDEDAERTPQRHEEGRPHKTERKERAERFASMVQEELNNSSAAAPSIRNKQQILRRLNSL